MTDTIAGIAVIRSKLQPVQLPHDDVRRSRLDLVFDADHQVVVVTAPAGYGKSTAVAGWVHRSPHRRTAWVSLDPLDRNPLSFWRHVTAAIGDLCPGADEADAILVERGHPGPEFVAALTRALWDDRRPLVLVIDDLQHAHAPAMRDELTTLVERCHGLLRLVAISRTDPPLPTTRWLTEGRAVELRMDALAFRPEEAVALMQRFSVETLDEAGVERLNVHVEGWAVGLLLSGLTLEGRPDLAAGLDDLIHSDRHLTTYLADEVLERLPDDLRELAFTLSVPPTFDVELTRRLTGRPDASVLLERLVRSNPFVVATPSPPAYRFHHLVRALLAKSFRSVDPGGFERVHREGAAALVERGHVTDAIALLLEVGDVDEAFDVVTAPALGATDQGRMRELAHWLEMLDDVEPSDPMRALDHAMALLLAGRTAQALAAVDRVGELHRRPGNDRFDAALTLTRLTTLAAAGLVDEAAPLLPAFDDVLGDVAGSHHLDSRMSSQLARLALEIGDLERADRWIQHLRRHPLRSVSEVLAPALSAWLLLEHGKVRRAHDEAGTACSAAERLGLRPHLISFDALLTRGRCELLAMRSDELDATLDALDADADAVDLPFFLLRLWPLRVQATAISQGWPAALELTETLDPDGYPRRGGRLASRYDELRALSLLNCGRTDEALPIVERLPPSVERALLTARSLMIGGRGDDLEAVLTGHQSWPVLQGLEATLLLAQARTGPEATATMSRALELGRRCGALAPFVLEGRRVERLLADLPVDRLFPDLADLQRAASTRRRDRPAIDVVEPLTPKELAVLNRLPSHATYRAIGAELFVSVNTIKTYVRSVYLKLGVTSRAEAVEVARQCGLLER